MDRITAEQRDTIKRTNSDRLRARLEQAGWSSQDLKGLDREKLMEAVAELYVVPAAEAAADVPKTESLVAKELELREREIALREREIKAQEEERKAQEKRWIAEMELKRAEYDRLQKLDAEKAKQDSSLAAHTKKFADSVKHVFIRMTDDPAELPMFFSGVENLYKLYDIPTDLQAKLLLPLLTKKARLVTNRLSLAELDDYEMVKQRILTEFRLTSREYLVRFRDAKKQSDESYVYFCSRLQNLLRYYLRSRKAENDSEKIIDVFVSDRLKESLSPSTLNYVLSLEGDDTFSSDKVAATADIHVNNYTEDGKFRSVSMSKSDQSHAHSGDKVHKHVSVASSGVGNNSVGGANASPAVPVTTKPKVRLCYKCKSDQHLFANCPLRNVRSSQGPQVNACMPVNARYTTTAASAAEPQCPSTQTDRPTDLCRLRARQLVGLVVNQLMAQAP